MVEDRHGICSADDGAETGDEVGSGSRGQRWLHGVTWETERTAVQEVGRTATRVLADRGPHAEEDEGQVIVPGARARGHGPGHQPLLESPVLTLYHPITLGMIGCSLRAGDAKQGGELRPEATGELAAAISGDRSWDAVS